MRIRYQNKQSKAHTQSSAPDKKLEQQEQWQFNKFIRLSNIFSPSHTYAYPLSCTHFVSDISQVIHFECSLSVCNAQMFRKWFSIFWKSNASTIAGVCFKLQSISFPLGRSILFTHTHTWTMCNDTPITIVSREQEDEKTTIQFNSIHWQKHRI